MLGSSPSQDFLVAPEVENKVRNLLFRTELSEIASKARVLVEITDEIPGPQGESLYNYPSLKSSTIAMEKRPAYVPHASSNTANKEKNTLNTQNSQNSVY